MIAAFRARLAEPGFVAGLARLIAAIAVLQAFYWSPVNPLRHIPDPPTALFEVTGAEAARIATPDQAGIAAAQFAPTQLPYTGCCEPAFYVVRLHVQIDKVPPDGIGMTPNVDTDNLLIYANDQLAFGEGRMDLPNPTNQLLREIFFIPPGLLVAGNNRIDLVTARASTPYADVFEPMFGPWRAMKSAYAWREFMFEGYGWFSFAIAVVLALLTLVLVLRGRRAQGEFWLLVLLLAWCARLILPLIAEFGSHLALRPALFMGAEMVLATGWCNFANHWGRRPIRWVTPLATALGLASLAGIFWCNLAMPSPDGFETAGRVLELSGLALTVVALGLFARNIVLSGTRRIWETATFSLLVTLFAADMWSELVAERVGGNIVTSLPLVFVGLAAAFLSRNVHLFRSMEEYNQRLATELAAREQEIADSYAQRQEVARQQALLSERQRIMRDMHDGMGGRLMSIAAQLKGQGAAPSPELLADELLEALDELRLIVDSLDTAGDDLGMALGAFRARMESKLAAAGIESEWTIDDDAAETSLSASAILDIYRIMQEACANMLRYSGADHFEVALRTREDGAVLLEMADNGRGLEDSAGTGKGLANMRSRAARLGGQIGFAVNAPGLKISLLLPPRPQVAAADT